MAAAVYDKITLNMAILISKTKEKVLLKMRLLFIDPSESLALLFFSIANINAQNRQQLRNIHIHDEGDKER